MNEYKDATGRLIYSIQNNISYEQFAEIADVLIKRFDAKIIEKVEDGFSTRYWDVAISNAKLSFHYHEMICDFEIISLEGNRSDETIRQTVAMLDDN